MLSIEAQREMLAATKFEADSKYRILFIGRFFQGPTGIVASLHRALAELGHTIFPLDPAEHGYAFENPDQAAGGYGPIFFSPDRVRRIFERFSPEIVIFCAGGVVLDTLGADFLRKQNVISIGVTLSDPDVQDSIIDFVENFDFHTTNSKLACSRYRERGINNTFLMPFGIDRQYVLREVPFDPELAADVICIGHATSRPDRHSVMSRVGSRFHVRVYGEGWPNASETVSGDRLLQAARAGKFHINFPATRAGFTNVKCGVFESIGVGAVLCTTRFDEMADLFSYENEIVGYEDADDLVATLDDLMSNPNRVEQLRRNSFNRLVSEHLYEHRWLTLFADIYEAVHSNLSCKDSDERSRIRHILHRSHGRPKNVVVSGFYGARNWGDDLILEAISANIREKDSDVNIVVAAVNSAVVERYSGLPAFNRSDYEETEKQASGASAVVLGAGGLWHDYTIARAGGVSGIVSGAKVSPAHLIQLPLISKAYGGRFFVYGMGVGPLKDPAARAVVRLSGSLAESIVLRDSASVEAISGISDDWRGSVEQSPDAVYGLSLDGSPYRGTLPDRYVVLNLRDWPAEREAVINLRSTLLRFFHGYGIPVVALPMQPADLKALIGDGAEYRNEYIDVVSSDISSGELFEVIRGASCVVSMRLHANLLAHRLNIPAVGLAYDRKVQSHFEEVGREDYALPLSVEEAVLLSRVRATLSVDGLPSEVLKKLRVLESLSRQALERLAENVAACPTLVSPTSGMVHRAAVQSANLVKDSKLLDVGRATAVPPAMFQEARVSAGNTFNDSALVPMSRSTTSKGDRFQLEVRAPRKGDYVEWSIPLDLSAEAGKRIEVSIKQKYGENTSYRGYMRYEIGLDSSPICSQDIVDWNPRNTIWFGVGPRLKVQRLTVRLIAQRDCPDWNWGDATALTVESVRLLPWSSNTDFVWGASSPFMRAAARSNLMKSKTTPLGLKTKFLPSRDRGILKIGRALLKRSIAKVRFLVLPFFR